MQEKPLTEKIFSFFCDICGKGHEAQDDLVFCPFCGKWVCKDCFRPEDDEFGGSCKECNGEE